MKAGRVRGIGVEVFLNEVPDCADGEHDVDERRHQRQQNLEDHDVRQRHEAQRSLARENSTVLVDSLQNAERPAKTLAHQPVGIRRSLRIGQRHVFIFHAVTAAQ